MPFWVAYLQPGRTSLALACLRERDCETYCPLVINGHGSPEPLFYGYLFIRTQPQWSPVACAPGILRLIGNRGAPPDRVPDALIESIRRREGPDGYVRLPRRVAKPRLPDVQPGDRVRVVHGPLFGRDGLCVGLSSHQRVTILLQALGKLTLSRADVIVV